MPKSLSQDVSRIPQERQSLEALLQEDPLRREPTIPVAEPSGFASPARSPTGFGIGSKCILCGSGESERLRVGARCAPEVEVWRCRCGLVYLWPQPEPEVLAEYYRETYREDYGDPPAGEQFERDMPEARSRAERVAKWLRPTTRILDVGSSTGAFLSAVGPRASEAVGVEPHGEYRAESIHRGLRVVPNVEALDGHRFDVITLFHVLEHTENPVEFLRGMARLLAPGGRLLIEVPNLDDALVSVYRIPAYTAFYYQKAHLYYFSRATLDQVLDRAGLEGPIEGIQRYDLSNHMRWMLTGKPEGQGYYADLLGLGVNRAYTEALIRAGRSDTLWAAAQVRAEASLSRRST